MWRPEENYRCRFSLSTIWVPRTKLRSLILAARAFVSWALSPSKEDNFSYQLNKWCVSVCVLSSEDSLWEVALSICYVDSLGQNWGLQTSGANTFALWVTSPAWMCTPFCPQVIQFVFISLTLNQVILQWIFSTEKQEEKKSQSWECSHYMFSWQESQMLA